MINFHYVRWKNFLSTGNTFTEIQLDRNNTTLIVGENGAGKSTILDALCFGLFGKPFRVISKTQLINTINDREAIVEVCHCTHPLPHTEAYWATTTTGAKQREAEPS